MRVIFFGTPSFASTILEKLIDNKVNIVAVVSKPDKPQGRRLKLTPTAVKALAEERLPGIPIYQPEKASTTEFLETLRSHQPDLMVVVAYGEIISQSLLDLPDLGCINVHASLLPKYRGAAPIQRCLMNGDSKSGVSVMYMVKKMDAGDVIKVREVKIPKAMNYGELELSLRSAGVQCLLDVVKDFEQGKFQRTSQDLTKVTFAPKIEIADYQFDWDKSATDLHNIVRAFSPKPGARCFIYVRDKKKQLKILKTEVVNLVEDLGIQEEVFKPSEIVEYNKNNFIVKCKKNALKIIELQLEGKKKMEAKDFISGFTKDLIRF